MTLMIVNWTEWIDIKHIWILIIHELFVITQCCTVSLMLIANEKNILALTYYLNSILIYSTYNVKTNRIFSNISSNINLNLDASGVS